MLLDVEIYNSQNQKVSQQLYENQNFSTTSKSFTFNWTPTSTGVHTIKVGVFNANWSELKHWNNNAKTFTVVSQNQTTPTPTINPSPSATTAPTATPKPSITPTATPSQTPTIQPANIQVEIWWPVDGVIINGTQPFKAKLNDRSLDQYKMYWQVDSGTLNEMYNSNQDSPHKESYADVNPWNWRGNGPYKINFVARDNSNNSLSQKEISITIAR